MPSELWWASVGGNTCEPIRVIKDRNGKPKEWFSIGCADPHPIADEGFQLVAQITVPLTPEQAERKHAEWEAKVEADRKRGIIHGYRRFD